MNKKEKCVSVVIPSYNRASLLKKTIPSYWQDLVGEIIVIDDASNDNTEEVIKDLQSNIPILKYKKLSQNRKQTFAKNEGIHMAIYPYIYFGDDDSIIVSNTINYLMETMRHYKADAVGARALYMGKNDDISTIDKFIYSTNKNAKSDSEIFTIKDFDNIVFDWIVKKPIEVPFCHACALVKTEIAKKILFNIEYRGNAYREETDFFTRMTKKGYKIFYDSRGIQINLPKKNKNIIKNAFKTYFYNINNTFKYFNSNYAFLKEKYNLKDGLKIFKLKYFIKVSVHYLNKIINKIEKRCINE